MSNQPLGFNVPHKTVEPWNRTQSRGGGHFWSCNGSKIIHEHRWRWTAYICAFVRTALRR